MDKKQELKKRIKELNYKIQNSKGKECYNYATEQDELIKELNKIR